MQKFVSLARKTFGPGINTDSSKKVKSKAKAKKQT